MQQLTGKRRGQLDFIARVLAEAERSDRTAAERASFLAIVERDLEEFLSVRCPQPDAEVRARVTELYARLDALACALVPPTPAVPSAEGDEPVWRTKLLQDESASVGETPDVREAVIACLAQRETARVVQLACPQAMPEELVQQRLAELNAPDAMVRRWPGDRPMREQLAALCSEVPRPVSCERLPEEDLLAAVARQDRLLIHPYDSYSPVIRLLEQAAKDPAVCAISITLYRYEPDGQVVSALTHAAARGASVTCVLELRARGMEQTSLVAAEHLAAAGVRVVTPGGARVHGKVLLIERQEDGEIRSCAHFATGNYHAGNARHYTDVSLLTADPSLCADAKRFFDAIAAGATPRCETCSVSPGDLRTELVRLIRREMSHALAGRPCGVRAKVNALTDKRLIAALTEAARMGVPIDLTVRGVCLLPPGGGITVRSIVGRQLEHARVCVLENGGCPEAYISSADWMPRSFDRRHELLIPVRAAEHAQRLHDWLTLQARDTANSWVILMNEYTALRSPGVTSVDSQALMQQSTDRRI